ISFAPEDTLVCPLCSSNGRVRMEEAATRLSGPTSPVRKKEKIEHENGLAPAYSGPILRHSGVSTNFCTNGIVEQPDPHVHPRYCGLSTYARLPSINEVVSRFDIAVVGIPFDAGCTFRPGARFGPEAIRRASRLIRRYNMGVQAYPFRDVQVVDYGDISCNPLMLTSTAMDQVSTQLSQLLSQCNNVIIMGGDHTISYPSLKAIHAKHGPVSLVHFDSHFDTWDEYFGERCTHGTPFKRAIDDGLINTSASMHVGIRGSVNDHEDIVADAELGLKTVFCSELDDKGSDWVVDKIRTRVGSTPVYLSVDIDVADPAFAPGTGTPEARPNGLGELIRLLRSMKGLNIVSGDVVEVAPPYDHADITAQLGANIIFEMLSLLSIAR
ncbi:unnamed protein product, partial [Discosporangium mesarthrocarpum]